MNRTIAMLRLSAIGKPCQYAEQCGQSRYYELFRLGTPSRTFGVGLTVNVGDE